MGSKVDKRGDYQIPFTKNGDLMTYPSSQWENVGEGNGDRGHLLSYVEVGPVWKDNFEFTGTLEFDRFERGRSAAHALFKDPHDDTEYTMFLAELSEAIPKMVDGTITGTFTFTKRGQNYGVKFLG